ncbi:restriction endonuclease subunit S [Aquiflexum gelatinilyticum]|uniref:restriction endonuclease subunit S n=1 Tax=Aquiflexum gelatinilyticum TaxID=2961943 RepID=UPI00216A61BD|nr:restriction endonuclease subunit S [Aquiflexum gelatinilyticum]MCS4435336.1 restriction endonuclease subunit S [Aquiflexum gelatinilyticum]
MAKTKYQSYISSKTLWQREIPSHWQETELRMLFADNKNKNIGLVERNLLSLSYGKLKRKDIDNATGLVPASFEGYQIIDEGFIVLRFTDLQNDKKSLRVGYVEERGIITSAYIGLAPKADIHSKYYYYQLHFLDKIKYFYNLGGGVRQSLAFKEFGRETVLIPPKEEQTAIVRFLDYKLAKINRFIQKKKQLLSLYAEKRKSLTRELINSKNVKYLRLSSVAKLIQRPIEAFENEFYTPVGLYNRGRGLFHKEATLGKELGDSSFYFINKGDVILSGQFAWEGAVALVDLEDDGCVASHRYPVLDCNLNIIIPEYLFSFFTISEGHLLLDYHSRGAAGRNRPLNPRYLIKEKIPVPDIALQKELIKLIERENELKAIIKKEISLAEEYKTALIAEAVTGKIDVRGYEVPELIEEETYEEIEDEISMAAEDGEEYEMQSEDL